MQKLVPVEYDGDFREDIANLFFPLPLVLYRYPLVWKFQFWFEDIKAKDVGFGFLLYTLLLKSDSKEIAFSQGKHATQDGFIGIKN